MMHSFQRREMIKQLLLKEKSITVNDVAQRFDVSSETIRRDLNALSEEGFCNKTYGGASLANRSTVEVPQHMKKGLFVAEKQFMAKIAASFIRPGDCIFLDHSTTVSEMCQEIRDMKLTVVTNSLWVVDELENIENIKLILTGGSVRPLDRGMFGQETLDFLKEHYFDKAFFSCRGLNLRNGVFDASEIYAYLHRYLIDRSGSSYLLADHTKFGVSGFVNIIGFSDLDNLITDRPLDREWSEEFEKNHVTVYSTQPPAWEEGEDE